MVSNEQTINIKQPSNPDISFLIKNQLTPDLIFNELLKPFKNQPLFSQSKREYNGCLAEVSMYSLDERTYVLRKFKFTYRNKIVYSTKIEKFEKPFNATKVNYTEWFILHWSGYGFLEYGYYWLWNPITEDYEHYGRLPRGLNELDCIFFHEWLIANHVLGLAPIEINKPILSPFTSEELLPNCVSEDSPHFENGRGNYILWAKGSE